MITMASVIGRNVLFCRIRYGFIVDVVLRGACPPQCIKVNYFKGIDEGTITRLLGTVTM